MGDDWDLHAVVRGCAASAAAPAAEEVDLRRQHVHLGPKIEEDSLISFPPDERFESRSTTIEDLQELYRPFFPKSPPPSSLSPQSMSFGPPPPPPLLGEPNHSPKRRFEPQKHHQKQLHATNLQGNRTKRRKNQQKTVCHIPAEGLTSDVWAWRKYGQKPIKGSPYPRGYYRCSSSKGCLARKQVERNKSDPAMFIVTYTAEHNHPAPTHRNSLAGSTRQKPSFSSATAGDAPDGDPGKPADKASPPSPCSPGSGISNTTSPSPAAMTDSRVAEDDLAAELEDEDEEFGLLSEMTMNDDDFFEGLEELEGGSAGDFVSDQFPATFSLPWTANNAATAAGSS